MHRKVFWAMVFLSSWLTPGQLSSQSFASDTAPFQSSRRQQSEAEILANLQEHNHQRETRLQRYSVIREYSVLNADGTLKARMRVWMKYESPSTKKFVTLCEQGSHLVRNLVFKRLMESEIEAASGSNHRDSSITPLNYDFHFLRSSGVEGEQNLVLNAKPRRKDKYLFEGEIWIDSQDFAIARVIGHPASNPSFWLKKVDFVRQYQRVGDFWLPLRDESVNHIRLFGKKTLTVSYFDYQVNIADSHEPGPNMILPEGCHPPEVSH